MRLISQVANEIWICDHKTINKYKGDIQNFKMDMRKQMGIDGPLKGDASVKKKEGSDPPPPPKKEEPKLEVVAPRNPSSNGISNSSLPPLKEEKPVTLPSPPAPAPALKPAAGPATEEETGKKKYIPPHLRKKMQQQ